MATLQNELNKYTLNILNFCAMDELKSILAEVSQSTCNIEEIGIGVHNSVDYFCSNPKKLKELILNLRNESERINNAIELLDAFYKRWQKI